MPVPRKGSGSSSEEQWSLVEMPRRYAVAEQHHWRLRTFKNGRGELRPGLACDWCHAVQVLTVSQLKALDARWRQEYR